MKNLWDKEEAKKIGDDPLALRVYSSRLLGASKELVLHGGGNTSVKIDNYLFVKGSGWNLDTIEKEGFPAVELETLIKLASRESLSDSQMVSEQKAAMRDKSAPNPSVEAILHAIIPFKFVDHTHTDAVVTITNTPNSQKFLSQIYGDDILIIDYVMPGFILAKEIYEKTKDIDWSKLNGIILLNHGLFTFDDDAKKSYDKMIDIVTKAEEFLDKNAPLDIPNIEHESITEDELNNYNELIAPLRGTQIKSEILDTPEAIYFSTLNNLKQLIHQGTLTPEHVIRTKPYPLLVENDFESDLKNFVKSYKIYFDKYSKDEIMLDLAPRYAIIKNRGIVLFGKDEKENLILRDIVSHTIKAIMKAQKLSSWQSLNKKELFKMEYWELEQAKLKK